jgi:hypothetical protein
MKAFITACAVALTIAIVTAVIFTQLGWDSAAVYSSSNVRL